MDTCGWVHRVDGGRRTEAAVAARFSNETLTQWLTLNEVELANRARAIARSYELRLVNYVAQQQPRSRTNNMSKEKNSTQNKVVWTD